jgi:hypothetical protein
MGIRKNVWIRDCLAIAAILLCVASAAAQAQAQVLASYRVCAVSTREACAQPLERDACAKPARTERENFLLWAVAMHRAGASNARVTLRTVNPVVVADDTVVEVADVMRNIACSH